MPRRFQNSSFFAKARAVCREIPAGALRRRGINVDRVDENPEAARYFLMFADWGKIVADEIFGDLEGATAKATHVYVDLPYCGRFCSFCAFYGVVPRSGAEMEAYVASLKREVRMIRDAYFNKGFRVASLEFGGGTPTFLPLKLLRDVTECVRGELPFMRRNEFSFEASPETLTGTEGLKKLEYLKSAGANRMSIGVQSFDETILRVTNRPHTGRDIALAIANAKAAGYERINADLMVGLPGQTPEKLVASVEKAVGCGFDIIELYVMRYFDTKEFVPLKNSLSRAAGFMTPREVLVARIAADILLREAGYTSSNGRTYMRPGTGHDFYAAYYRGNFSGENTLGIGRKSNSNVYPWQYANYRSLEKYEAATMSGRLPIAAGTRFTRRGRAAKLLTGMFQLPEPIDYEALRLKFPCECAGIFDGIIKRFVSLGLLEKRRQGYEKTFLGFLFIEEMLKQFYDAAVTPFNTSTLFLGKRQSAGRRQSG